MTTVPALLLTRTVATVEPRLYAWCVEVPGNVGTQRQTLDVPTCFVPFRAWIVRLWHENPIALTRDATTLSERFVVRTIPVIYRGIGMPAAWSVRHAGCTPAWRREWVRIAGCCIRSCHGTGRYSC
ncbi:hypothetical protein [Roseiflexus sp.]|uniref:hypothetical protein n=1 Tax=Roseiflexus sp. TaxID=2562120 RepID=UPI00398B2B05